MGISPKHWNAQERQALRDDVAAPRLQGPNQGSLSVRSRQGMPGAVACGAAGDAATSITSAVTRPAISSRWTGLSMPDIPPPRRCSRNSVAPGRGSVEPAYDELRVLEPKIGSAAEPRLWSFVLTRFLSREPVSASLEKRFNIPKPLVLMRFSLRLARVHLAGKILRLTGFAPFIPPYRFVAIK